MPQIVLEHHMEVKHHLLHHHIRKNYLGKIIYNVYYSITQNTQNCVKILK